MDGQVITREGLSGLKEAVLSSESTLTENYRLPV